LVLVEEETQWPLPERLTLCVSSSYFQLTLVALIWTVADPIHGEGAKWTISDDKEGEGGKPSHSQTGKERETGEERGEGERGERGKPRLKSIPASLSLL
jgi:hypothetical protein